MTLWGIDISGWQAGIDLDQVAREGFSAVIAKASEGQNYTSPAYAEQKAGAQRAGLRFMAYHYVRAGSPAAQVDNYERAEADRRVPVMLDHEENSGNVENLRAVHAEFVRRGYRVALIYLPRWYWRDRIDHFGNPNLFGLPPLMASSYGDDQPGYASALYPGDDAEGWNPYGGGTVAILQFTQRARVAGLQIDAWAFRGDMAALDALFGAESETPMDEAQDVQIQLRGPGLNGWPQLGGRTVVDALAAIGEHLGIPGFAAPKGGAQ
ncbi:glycoside hydrolase family 25 protein [Nocardia niigatensis]